MPIYCEESKLFFTSVETMNKFRRIQAHNAFDPIRKWKKKHKKKLGLIGVNVRNQTYENLAKKLGKTKDETHMLYMDKADCLRVIDYCHKWKKKHMWGTKKPN